MRSAREVEELRETMKLIREDVNKNFLDIRQVLSKTLTLNYLLIISKHLLEEMDALIDGLECRRARVKEASCKKVFRETVKEYTNDISASNIERALGKLDDFLDLAEQRLNNPSYPEDCKQCWQKLRPALALQKAMIKSVSILEGRQQLPCDVRDIRDLDERKIFQDVVKPVAHVARLTIMKSVLEGKSRFSELVEASKLTSGHLIYHLRLLKKHNLITQDAAKNYAMSPKGFWTLAALRQAMEETENRE